MKNKLKRLQAELEELIKSFQALAAKEDATAEDETEAERLLGEIKVSKAEVVRVEALVADEEEAQKSLDALKEVKSTVPFPVETEKNLPESAKKVFAVPARGKADSFGGDRQLAHDFGMWLFAEAGHPQAKAYCKHRGIATKAMYEGNDATGGINVPVEFDNAMILLRESYGLFRQFAHVVPMSTDQKVTRRQTGGLTAYPVGEGKTITASDITYDGIELVARKWAAAAQVSNEYNEESVLDIGNTVAHEIAYAFAKKEDECGFLGDGSGTYNRITGIIPGFKALSSTRANIAGLVVGSGNSWSELTLSDHEAVVARLPQYADTPGCAWYCHRAYYWNVMVKLLLASGGVTAAEVAAGAKTQFLGYDVKISQILPGVEANDDIPALFGDLAQAVTFGDRRGTTIAMSEHTNFLTDELVFRGTERFDINVHDIGNQSATAASRVAGPLVGLLTAAS
jgi:HK97 family phage major capsid protein